MVLGLFMAARLAHIHEYIHHGYINGCMYYYIHTHTTLYLIYIYSVRKYIIYHLYVYIYIYVYTVCIYIYSMYSLMNIYIINKRTHINGASP